MTLKRKSIALALTIIGGLHLGFCLPLIPVASDDIRMVNVFSIDETDIVVHVWNLYVTEGQTRPSYKYGGVFYYVPTLVLYVWSVFGNVTEQLAIILVRLYCVLSGLGCLWLTYVIGREVFDRWVGIIATLLLMVGTTFLRWSVESHPDLPQLFFLLGSLLFACRCAREFQTRSWVLAALFAGLAFGTKYGGVFLLPILVLAVFAPSKAGTFLSTLAQKKRWLAVGGIPLVFALAFVVTNSMAVINPIPVINTLAAEKQIMGFGHRLAATSDPWMWLTLLLGFVGTIHCLVLVGVTSWLVVTRQWQGIRSDRVVLVIWIVLFLGYLMVESQLKRPRHLLPIVPGVLLFVSAAYGVIWTRLKERWVGLNRWYFLFFIVVMSWGHLQASAFLFVDRYGREVGREEIVVGRWLADTFPKETTVMFDVYAYVPKKFGNVYRTIGMSYVEVNHFEPELLVVRDAVVSDYLDLEEAHKFRQGPLKYLNRHYFYRYLQQGLIPSYQLLRDFGRVAVYQRIVPRVSTEGDVRKRWRFLVQEYRKQHFYGLVAAHWTMGYIHEKQSKLREANADFQQAREASNFSKRLYSHGTHMLNAGQVQMARHAFESALDASRSESTLYQAGMREDLAFRFFKARQFQDMLAVAGEALRITDNLPAASFEQAVAHLALGNTDRGMALFGDAVDRFSAHVRGKRLLDEMAAMDVQVEVARRLVAQYYGGPR